MTQIRIKIALSAFKRFCKNKLGVGERELEFIVFLWLLASPG